MTAPRSTEDNRAAQTWSSAAEMLYNAAAVCLWGMCKHMLRAGWLLSRHHGKGMFCKHHLG